MHPNSAKECTAKHNRRRAPALPALLSASEPLHTAAMELEPWEASVSACRRTMKGKSSSSGIMAARAFSARAPWPISRRLGPAILPTSCVQKGGKLRGNTHER